MPNRRSRHDEPLARTGTKSFRGESSRCILGFLLVWASMRMTAQSEVPVSAPGTLPVVMLSDLHFDPFHDPEKVPLLAKASMSEWRSILTAPDSAEQATRFASMQEVCKAKDGTDAPYALLRGSLVAAKAQSPGAGFVTISGDLLVHDLDCRYRAAMGVAASTAEDQSASAAFAEKTTAFVMEQVEAAFPKIPVYFALGNNDSRCNHNRLDLHDEYLASSASAVVAGLRGVNAAERAAAERTFESGGYYSVTMPAPVRNLRLIVLNDIYMMPKFTDCAAREDRKGEQEQLAWLSKELDSAQLKKQRVWVLGHLPPSVNADASLSPRGSFCSSDRIVRFQDSEALATEMMAHSDAIKLGIFGHTHMDEFHVMTGVGSAIPIKVLASVSPVDGNLPSFTVGVVDLASATLADYSVYEASNRTGLGMQWSQEYDFNTAYREQGFTPSSLDNLIDRLRNDKAGTGPESQMYQTHFLKGSSGKKLSSSWPGYVCSLDHVTAEGFKTCVCANP